MSKMDELKVYTGKETIEALLEGKTLKWAGDQYRLEGEQLKEKNGTNEWARSYRSLDHFMNNKFTEVVTPQVGDWVRVNFKVSSDVGKVTRISGQVVYAKWNNDDEDGHDLSYSELTWEILSPKQVSEYKREQAFVKVGRKPNEFRFGDIVYAGGANRTAIVTSKVQGERVKLHGINETKGYSAKPHQLTPISFVENQVSLD